MTLYSVEIDEEPGYDLIAVLDKTRTIHEHPIIVHYVPFQGWVTDPMLRARLDGAKLELTSQFVEHLIRPTGGKIEDVWEGMDAC